MKLVALADLLSEIAGRNVLSHSSSSRRIIRGLYKVAFLPLTVTDREMKRYFMTIPEAVSLVLHASILGNGGDVFVRPHEIPPAQIRQILPGYGAEC